MVAADPARIQPRSGQELGGDAAAQEPPAPREAELLAAPVRVTLDEAELDEASQRVAVERVADIGDDDRLVEPQPEQQELSGTASRRRSARSRAAAPAPDASAST